jgi:hypothetical protein
MYKRLGQLIFIAVLLLVVNLNCVNNKSQAVASNIIAEPALIFQTCAPWDGSAVTIYISKAKQSCEQVGMPNLTISIYQNITQLLGKEITLPDEKQGHIVRRMGAQEFLQIKSAKVQFINASEQEDVSGSYQIEFENGEKVNGKFIAKWCKRVMPCG